MSETTKEQRREAALILRSARRTNTGGHNGGRPPYKHYCPACRTKMTARAFSDAGQKCPVCSNVGVTEIQPRKKVSK